MQNKLLMSLTAAGCALLGTNAAQAQDMYLGQVFTVSFQYCPEGSLEANGQQVSVPQNQALYALIGNLYGGTAGVNFNLPDLRGRTPIGEGAGPGLTPMVQANKGGQESVTISVAQMPAHNHTGEVVAISGGPTINQPGGNALATYPAATKIYGAGTPTVPMADGTVVTDSTGGGGATPVRDPYLVLRYCVVTSGYWPPKPN